MKIRWFKSRSLAAKLFIYYFCLSLFLFVILAWTNLNDSSNLFKKQVIRDSQNLIVQTNEFLNAYSTNIQTLLLLLTQRNDLLEDGKENEAKAYLQHFGDLNRTFIKTIYFVRTDKKIYSNRQVYYDIVGNSHLDELFQSAWSSYGAFISSEPYITPLSGKTVAFTGSIYNQNNQITGVAIVEIDLDDLTHRLKALFPSSSQTFALMTSANRLMTVGANDFLLPYNNEVYPVQLDSRFEAGLGNLEMGVSNIDGANGSLVAVKSNQNRLHWSVISLIDEKFFYQNLFHLYKNYEQAAIVWIVILIISSFLFSRYFTRPIRKLVASMDRVKSVELLPRVSIDREDEIGHLARSYTEMMKRIQELFQEVKDLERKKNEYQFQMLQNQINPHFLYNTLSCISSLAKQQKTDQVRETVRSLGALLSYTFSNSLELVALSEEIKVLKRYVQIQNIRYGERFEIIFDIDSRAMDYKILKLSLQPLVENAIFHGIIPQRTKGTVWIYCRIVRDKLILYVRDNGKGIAPERRSQLLQKPQDDRLKERFNHIGLMNVHERIQLHFGHNYGLTITSKINRGTVVRIEVPVITPEDSL